MRDADVYLETLNSQLEWRRKLTFLFAKKHILPYLSAGLKMLVQVHVSSERTSVTAWCLSCPLVLQPPASYSLLFPLSCPACMPSPPPILARDPPPHPTSVQGLQIHISTPHSCQHLTHLDKTLEKNLEAN